VHPNPATAPKAHRHLAIPELMYQVDAAKIEPFTLHATRSGENCTRIAANGNVAPAFGQTPQIH
jgi:hypothetical protein